jgi:hypothetical protein
MFIEPTPRLPVLSWTKSPLNIAKNIYREKDKPSAKDFPNF